MGNCRCLAGDRAGCTRRLCGDRTTWEEGRTCSEGARWEEKTGRNNQCQCLSGNVFCVAESDAVEEVEIPREKQCQDKLGSSRDVGDVWDVDCNTCRCTDTGVAACTQRLCNFNLGGSEQCTDSDGVSRLVGEEWEEEETGSKVNFPEERRAAAGVRSSRRGSEALLRIVEEASQASQCNQAGVTRCRGVQANLALIKTLRAGSTLDLVQGEGLAMELRSLPKITRSGGFSPAFLLADGGEANIVIGTSGSMFGSINPLSGDVHQVLESCGDNCSVLMERPSDFFNQFED